jgi:four helix bundle protein
VSTGKRSDFRDLLVWRKAMALAAGTYRVTPRLPREGIFGRTGQLRRSAVSVPSNIAEGSSRGTTREFIRFLHVARGSLGELQTQLLIARDVGYLTEVDLEPALTLVDEVGRLLNAVISGLHRRQCAQL